VLVLFTPQGRSLHDSTTHYLLFTTHESLVPD
jgi:hypothetical protein